MFSNAFKITDNFVDLQLGHILDINAFFKLVEIFFIAIQQI